MARRTKFIVYVDKDVMTKPTELFDAVISHLIKKELDIRERKDFIAQFMKAPTEKHKMAVIESWVQVRDVADFPFRKESAPGIIGAEAGKALRKEMLDGKAPEGMVIDEHEATSPSCSRTSRGIEGTADITFGKEQAANTAAEGGVPVDEGAGG